MNTKDVIEAYVADVAVHLPRKQRNDVAFELRALLHDELQAKAEATGRGADAAQAIELLQAFGRPSEVAARYRPALAVIDPADGHRFLRWTWVGLVVIWCLGLVEAFQQPIVSGGGGLQALGRWWAGTVVGSLWWPGVLVVGFGLSAWVRRRWPGPSDWKPRADDRIQGGRASLMLAFVGALCGLVLLFEPRWLLDVLWGGRAAPAAYEALTYTETFRHRQGPWLLGLVGLNLPLWIVVLVQGRWAPLARRLEAALVLVTCGVVIWTVLDGPVFLGASGDRMCKFWLVVIVVFTLLHGGVKLYRTVRPSPDGITLPS